MTLEIKNISKKFGQKKVLNNVNLKIKQGQCVGIVGKNGAGKSTLLNIISGILSYDTGVVKLFGYTHEENSRYIKKNIGILPEFNPVIDEFTGLEYLNYVGLIYNLANPEIDKRSRFLINYFFESEDEVNKNIADFSRGMKIKMGICAALIHKPPLLILDEPFNGLDITYCNRLATFLTEYRKKGNTIIVSSHDLPNMKKIASQIGLLDKQKIISTINLPPSSLNSRENLDKHISEKLGTNIIPAIDF